MLYKNDSQNRAHTKHKERTYMHCHDVTKNVIQGAGLLGKNVVNWAQANSTDVRHNQKSKQR